MPLSRRACRDALRIKTAISLIHGISRQRCEAISLERLTLPAETYTSPTKVIIREGQSVQVRLASDIDDRVMNLERWRQLGITSASATISYVMHTHNDVRNDIQNTDLSSGFGNGRTWRGEVDDTSDISNSIVGVWWVRGINNIRWRSTAGAALNSVSSIANTFQSPASWLGSMTFANAQTYFQTNAYNGDRSYFYYDTELDEVRKFVRTITSTWTTLTAGKEHDEVASTEVMINTALLVSSGIITISLVDDSITEDKIDQFRIEVSLNQ